MIGKQTEAEWHKLAEEVLSGMKEWRLQHPKATFAEMEAALDELLAKMKVRMLQDVALASAAADVTRAEPKERPRCLDCGAAMEAHGQDVREVTIQYNQTVRLTRSYAECPACGAGFFPPR